MCEEDYYYDYISEWVRGSEELSCDVQHVGDSDGQQQRCVLSEISRCDG